MKIDRTHAEEVLICHKERGFDLELPRARQKEKTEKAKGNDRGGS
jgi:hypothetical protein